jgi:hypothetical protein
MPMVAPLIDCFPARENLQNKLPPPSAVRMTEVGGFVLGVAPFASASVSRNEFLTGGLSDIT